MKNIKAVFLFLLLFLVLFPKNSSAQYIELTDNTQISLLTCSPGKEVYAVFGHSAIRLYDPDKGLDIAFNYGIFDFNTSNFYLKFIKGETDYKLGVTNTPNFLYEYIARNSSVWEQVLDLNINEKQKLADALFINYEPENRVYRYNFVYDNCATRPRDKIKTSLDSLLQYANVSSELTFRNWIARYTGTNTWLKFGIDIVIGSEADTYASREAAMFLPEVLMKELDNAFFTDSIGDKHYLVASNTEIVKKQAEEIAESRWFSSPLAFSVYFFIFVSILSYIDIKRRKCFIPFDSTILLITGLLGLVVMYLSFFSLHPLVKYNYNLLWLNPVNIITCVIIWIRSLKKIAMILQAVNFLLIIILLILFTLSIQDFNAAFFPIAAALLIRYTVYLVNQLKTIKKKIERQKI